MTRRRVTTVAATVAALAGLVAFGGIVTLVVVLLGTVAGWGR